jgi:hypothetical protein
LTEFTILNEVSVRHHALMMSKHAIDIQYNCPKCNEDRVFTWLFPDQNTSYVDECCNVAVHFEALP